MAEVKEQYLDGSTRVHRAVQFKNPTRDSVRFTGKNAIIRESQVKVGTHLDREGKAVPTYATRTIDLVIEPGAVVPVVEEVANLVQQFRCAECDKPWRFGQPGQCRTPNAICIDPSHRKVLQGGLAPQLLVVDDDDRVVVIEQHPNLGPEPSPQVDVDDLHARVMRRIGASK